jgi:glyoxylase-like metal-dependent hydrolase (beta-lactamase superfamily II)
VTEGDEIIPGVTVMESPGHSPGHISACVYTASGEYIVGGDAVMTLDNLKPVASLHYAVSPTGLAINFAEAWDSLEKIKNRAKSEDYVLAGHDKTLLERVAKTPVFK